MSKVRIFNNNRYLYEYCKKQDAIAYSDKGYTVLGLSEVRIRINRKSISNFGLSGMTKMVYNFTSHVNGKGLSRFIDNRLMSMIKDILSPYIRNERTLDKHAQTCSRNRDKHRGIEAILLSVGLSNVIKCIYPKSYDFGSPYGNYTFENIEDKNNMEAAKYLYLKSGKKNV